MRPQIAVTAFDAVIARVACGPWRSRCVRHFLGNDKEGRLFFKTTQSGRKKRGQNACLTLTRE